MGTVPGEVRRGDGTVCPFEPERITQSLFDAATRLGRGDPFLARELTESVLHFLAGQIDESGVTTREIADVVEKVVRELGHPALARAYAEGPTPHTAEPARPPSVAESWLIPGKPAWEIRQEAASQTLAAFALDRVFPSDLVSAHREGLIHLGGLIAPTELAGLTLDVPLEHAWQAMQDARGLAGEFFALDGPEYNLQASGLRPAEAAGRLLDTLGQAADWMGVRIYVNLNCPSPPARLVQASGPLFGETPQQDPGSSEYARELAGRAAHPSILVRWHGTAAPPRTSGSPLRVVPQRTRGVHVLAPGIDRTHPATLIRVGLNLPRLADMLGTPPLDADLFARKLASLTRFAKTAAHAKQDFLRKHGRPGLRDHFLLERARVVLVPMGLEAIATITDRPPSEFTREIPRVIRQSAERDLPRVLPISVDLEEDWPEWNVTDTDFSRRYLPSTRTT